MRDRAPALFSPAAYRKMPGVTAGDACVACRYGDLLPIERTSVTCYYRCPRCQRVWFELADDDGVVDRVAAMAQWPEAARARFKRTHTAILTSIANNDLARMQRSRAMQDLLLARAAQRDLPRTLSDTGGFDPVTLVRQRLNRLQTSLSRESERLYQERQRLRGEASERRQLPRREQVAELRLKLRRHRQDVSGYMAALRGLRERREALRVTQVAVRAEASRLAVGVALSDGRASNLQKIAMAAGLKTEFHTHRLMAFASAMADRPATIIGNFRPDGERLCLLLRQERLTRSVPIVLWIDTPADERDALAIGARHVITDSNASEALGRWLTRSVAGQARYARGVARSR